MHAWSTSIPPQIPFPTSAIVCSYSCEWGTQINGKGDKKSALDSLRGICHSAYQHKASKRKKGVRGNRKEGTGGSGNTHVSPPVRSFTPFVPPQLRIIPRISRFVGRGLLLLVAADCDRLFATPSEGWGFFLYFSYLYPPSTLYRICEKAVALWEALLLLKYDHCCWAMWFGCLGGSVVWSPQGGIRSARLSQ